VTDKDKAGSSSRQESRAKPAGKRTPKPPNTVRPGWLHKTLAASSLKVVQGRARAQGVEVDVGDIKVEAPEIAEGENGTEPVELLSRIIAHLFHRTPGLKKVEKRLEGEQRSSGILSDILALIVQIGRRNAPLIESAIGEVIERSGVLGSGGIMSLDEALARGLITQEQYDNLAQQAAAEHSASDNGNGPQGPVPSDHPKGGI
jgi:hypothetical protein